MGVERTIKDKSQFTMNRWELDSQEYYLDCALTALILVISLNIFCDQGVQLHHSEVLTMCPLLVVVLVWDA